MTGSNLKPHWDRWRLERFNEFHCGGMNFSSADELSRSEAAARQKVERCTDRLTALASGLAVVPNEQGEDQLVLLVPPDLISPDRKSFAKNALNVTGYAVRL
jgi:hypothetical protein